MVKVGLREANTHFSKYVKMVREGSEIMLTDRGTPVAIIKSVSQKKEAAEERLQLLEEQGILRRAVSGPFPLHKLIVVSGKPLSEIVSEDREDRF